MKKSALYILAGVSLWACTAPYTIDGKQAKRKLAVDGFISTLAGASRIILSYSSADFSTGSTEFVNHAAVTVTDEDGIITTFAPEANGKYVAQAGYAAKVGQKYHLKIIVDGGTYEADDTLFPVSPIAKLDFIENSPNNNDNRALIDYKYQVRYYAEKQAGKNYYQVVQYKNGQLYSRNNNGAFVYSDDVLKDGGNVLPVRFRYKKDDVARIDLLSISEAAYKFYNDLNNIQRNDGGMFNAPAANPVSNVSNGALGFFQASDDSYKEITIKP